MKVVSAIREMLSRGLSIEQALVAAEIMEGAEVEKLAKRRAADAARQAEKRERDKPSRESRDPSTVTVTVPSRAGARAEPTTNNSSSTHSENKEEEKQTEAGSGAVAPVSVLETVLDPDRAKAVVEHRSRMGKGKALTENSARLLATRLAACPDPNAAADEMIVRGWMSVKPDWLESRSTGPPGRPTNGRSSQMTWADVERAADEARAALEADQDQTFDLKALTH